MLYEILFFQMNVSFLFVFYPFVHTQKRELELSKSKMSLPSFLSFKLADNVEELSEAKAFRFLVLHFCSNVE